jgi:DNA-binding MurR/RpiR family transcriptional regulator
MGLQSTIEASIASLTPSTRRVAEAIRKDPRIVLDNSIAELAETCETSVASVVRFCRAIGLSGYSDLRMSLATELGKQSAQFGPATLGAEIAGSDTLRDMAIKVASLEMLAIDETVAGLDYDLLEKTVFALDQATRILLFGIGASQFVARDLHHKLLRIGRNAFFMGDTDEAWCGATLADERTVAIGFSHSGATWDTARFLEIARQKQALTVAVTSARDSAVARAADTVLLTYARESSLRAGAMVSRIAQLAMVDVLFLGVARLSYDDTIQALRHTLEITQARRR